MTFTAHDIRQVAGFFDDAEVALLHKLASEVKPEGVIVEIGSYRGKSTICLGMGARVSGAGVWAIDPHPDYMVDAFTRYGMENHAALLRNLTDYSLGATVRVVALESQQVATVWKRPIDLLFIDGSHEYDAVKCDFEMWSPHVRGLIAMHDTKGNHPDVTRFLNEVLAAGTWERIAFADATSVLRRRASE